MKNQKQISNQNSKLNIEINIHMRFNSPKINVIVFEMDWEERDAVKDQPENPFVVDVLLFFDR